ncbi:hypothetical protein [Paracoccus tegillarcae]|nr:hypothetical protein [Paracoccus tegillarcae]
MADSFDRPMDFDDDETRSRLVDFLPAAMLAVFGLLGLIAASLTMGGTDQFVIVAAPWTSRAEMTEMVWRAQGGVVGFGAVPAVAVAMSDAADFKDRLYRQGAWLALPSPRFLGCSGNLVEGENEE